MTHSFPPRGCSELDGRGKGGTRAAVHLSVVLKPAEAGLRNWEQNSTGLPGPSRATTRMPLMFAVDLPVASLYARFAGRGREVRRTARAGEQQDLLRQALAEMVPATAGELDEATGLDPLVTEDAVEHLTARYKGAQKRRV